uniref:uncharacterized protein LOC122594171 n=1 Tax=Erigeron canadensis TaxID=72917 RepID=UPI001CB998AB|nr:uncharacterized protein LOC122594171 [Erigeron canadensis]
MNVKYVINVYGYKFIITLEALEEDVVGVYEATVLCHCDDGRRTLLKFIQLPCPPVGRKFKGMTELAREKSMCQAVKEQKKAIKTELKIRCNAMKDRKKAIKSELKIRRKAMKGKRRSRESSDFICLKKHYKIVKGACHTFARYSHIMPMDWKIKRSNPDDWFVPNKNTGLQPRSHQHSCGGYDYYNPLTVFSCYT